MRLQKIDGNKLTTLKYYYDHEIIGDHNVAREYCLFNHDHFEEKAIDHMTHDDAVADIRDKTQRGFTVAKF